MEVRASLNQVRLAPRKVRAVTDVIKKKDALDARDQLAHMAKRPAPQIAKLLNSAIANAQNSYQMVPSNLYIKNIVVDEGMKLKRYMPRAQGRATEIQKKTSHITVILDERVAGLKQEIREAKKKEEPTPVQPEEQAAEGAIPTEKKPEVKKELGKKSGLFSNIRRRLFQRKSI